MDYCQPCRRHLNGALACAGCGTPAEALGPYAVPAYSGHEPEPRDESREPPVATGRRRRAPEPVRGRSAGKREGRTRRGRRGHRRRGRTALLAGLGVVLAVGALGVTRLATAPEGDSGAADYVRESVTTAEPVPDPSASVTADHPAPVKSPTVRPTVPAAGSTPSGAAKPTRTAPTEKSAAPDTPSPSGSAPTTAPPVPDDTDASTGPSGPVDGPTSAPAPQEPTAPAPAPTPEPTETCDWFLWWCT